MCKKSYISYLLQITLTFSLFFTTGVINAQEVRIIDNKGSVDIVNNNNVTTGTTAPTNPVENDIWFDTSITPNEIKIWDGTTWLNLEHTGTPGSIFFAGSTGLPNETNDQLFWNEASNSLSVGSVSGLTPTHKLNVNGGIRLTDAIYNAPGTVNTPSYTFNDDLNTGMYLSNSSELSFTTNSINALTLHSNSQIEFSEYGTGTFTGTHTYFLGVQADGQTIEVDPDDLNYSGTEGSVLFVDTDDTITENNTQFFWDNSNPSAGLLGIGTNSPSSPLHIMSNVGTGIIKLEGTSPSIILDETIGSNTNIIKFQRAGTDNSLVGINSLGNYFISMFNLGYNDDAFTINKVTSNVGIDVAVANSSLQVEGSVSKSIVRTTGALPLTENNYSVIITDVTHTITLPAANICVGREYVIKNTQATEATISSYQDNADVGTTTIPAANVLKVQSDGTLWNQMNNYSVATSTTGGGTTGGDTTPTTTFPNNTTSNFQINNYDDVGTDKEIRFGYGYSLPGGQPTITEIEIFIESATYADLIAEPSFSNGATIPNTNIIINSGPSASGSGFDHVITITGITLPQYQVLDFNFTTDVDGITTGGGNCSDCTVQLFTN